MISVDPATGRVLREYPEPSSQEIAVRLSEAQRAFEGWHRTPIQQRGLVLRCAAEVLRERLDELASLVTQEMGKPIVESEAEVAKCATVCDFYADHAEHYLAPQEISTEASTSFVRFDPLGPVLAVMPWNFPLWQVFRFAAPALMAGNVGLLKHASNVPGCALAIEEVFHAAGAPAGVFTSLLVSGREVESLIRHPAIQAVTLTGSDAAGRAVASAAGAALKKTVLELGGSDPFIVLADADLDAASDAAVKARCQNSGQSCIAAKRFIVDQRIATKFEQALVARMAALRVGHPMERATRIGPLAREDLLDDLHSLVRRSVESGARLLLGGARLERPGFYYAPTVLADVTPGMAVFDEETFGPVAAIVKARDTEDAVRLANQSRFGLGASLWTGDVTKGSALSEQLEVGAVFVNAIVKSDPRLPFGGVKASGYGRELSSFGIREFTNVKSVWIA